MDLEPVRLVLVYTCPVHAVIEQSKPGKCRICSRDLVQKTAALTFTCAATASSLKSSPGNAPMGRRWCRATRSARTAITIRSTAASSSWRRTTGITSKAPIRLPAGFRVYVYDDFSKPLGREQARKVRGRVVTKEAFDPKTGTTRELASTPLVLARNGAFFEARIEPLPLPAKMTAKIAFSADDKESRFDFAFPAYSRDVPGCGADDAAPHPSHPPHPLHLHPLHLLHRDLSLLSTDLKAQRAEVESLLKSGTLGGDLCAGTSGERSGARDPGANSRPASQDAIEASVKQIVLSAYQLDNYGDLGDAEKAQDAFRGMSAAIAQLDSLVSEPALMKRAAAATAPSLVVLRCCARRRRAQRCHVQVHLQRRRLSCVPESMRAVPHRRRRRTDVAPQIRGCVSLGRVAAR